MFTVPLAMTGAVLAMWNAGVFAEAIKGWFHLDPAGGTAAS